MPTNVEDIVRKLSPALRKRVKTRAAELIAEEMTLRELRHARKLTQVRMAKKLGITQDSVSRLEKRSDLLLSTLRKTVEAMGGRFLLSPHFLSPHFQTVSRLCLPGLPIMIRSRSARADARCPRKRALGSTVSTLIRTKRRLLH